MIHINRKTEHVLRELVLTGLFGTDITACADELLRRCLQEMANQGWVKR